MAPADRKTASKMFSKDKITIFAPRAIQTFLRSYAGRLGANRLERSRQVESSARGDGRSREKSQTATVVAAKSLAYQKEQIYLLFFAKLIVVNAD